MVQMNEADGKSGDDAVDVDASEAADGNERNVPSMDTGNRAEINSGDLDPRPQEELENAIIQEDTKHGSELKPNDEDKNDEKMQTGTDQREDKKEKEDNIDGDGTDNGESEKLMMSECPDGTAKASKGDAQEKEVPDGTSTHPTTVSDRDEKSVDGRKMDTGKDGVLVTEKLGQCHIPDDLESEERMKTKPDIENGHMNDGNATIDDNAKKPAKNDFAKKSGLVDSKEISAKKKSTPDCNIASKDNIKGIAANSMQALKVFYEQSLLLYASI